MADEEKVNTILVMFPDVNQASIRQLLKNTKGNVEQAIDNILNGNIPSVEEKKEVKKISQEEEDAILARQLQEGFSTESSSTTDLDEELAKSLAKSFEIDQDEAYARQLMLEDQSGGGGGYSYNFEDSRDTTPSINLKDLDQKAVDEILSQIKDQVIPGIKEQISQFEIPPIDEEFDAGKLGIISFGLKNVEMSEVEIKPENISLKLEDSTIKLVVTDVSASLKEFQWYYKKETNFPKLKIEVDLSIGGTGAQVSSAKIKGTSAVSVLYSLILALFKKTIKNQIEKALCELIKGSVEL